MPALTNYTDAAHAAGVKVKMYYTVGKPRPDHRLLLQHLRF